MPISFIHDCTRAVKSGLRDSITPSFDESQLDVDNRKTNNHCSARPHTRRRDEREDGMNQGKTPWPNTAKSAPVVEKFNFSIGFYPQGVRIIKV